MQPNPSADDRLGGKKLKHRHRILSGAPWSIASFADPDTGVVKRNMVYDGNGDAVAQIDFGHTSVGIHCHALVIGNLEHTAVTQEDHLFHMHDVPWPWLCTPWSRRGVCRPEQLPPTVDQLTYAAVSVGFEDYSDMGSMGQRSESLS